MKIIWLACPNCGKKLGSGRGFGPAKMTCPKCKSTFLTHFKGWNELDPLHKAFSVIGEFLTPSIFRRELFVSFLLNVFVGLYVIGIVEGLEYYLNVGKTILNNAIISSYPALLLLRLVLMIGESKAYDRSGNPPIWRRWR